MIGWVELDAQWTSIAMKYEFVRALFRKITTHVQNVLFNFVKRPYVKTHFALNWSDEEKKPFGVIWDIKKSVARRNVVLMFHDVRPSCDYHRKFYFVYRNSSHFLKTTTVTSNPKSGFWQDCRSFIGPMARFIHLD